MHAARMIVGMSLGVILLAGGARATEPAEVGKFVNARIEIVRRRDEVMQLTRGRN